MALEPIAEGDEDALEGECGRAMLTTLHRRNRVDSDCVSTARASYTLATHTRAGMAHACGLTIAPV